MEKGKGRGRGGGTFYGKETVGIEEG